MAYIPRMNADGSAVWTLPAEVMHALYAEGCVMFQEACMRQMAF